MKMKKISHIVIVCMFFSLIVPVNVRAGENSKNIVYFCSEDTQVEKFERIVKDKIDTVNIKRCNNISKDIGDASSIWIEYHKLVALHKNDINIIVQLLNKGCSLVVIKDNIDEKQVVDALGLDVKVPKVINAGNSFTQAIKIENLKDEYLFTGMNINEIDKSNKEIRKDSLVEGSLGTNVKDNYLNKSLQVFGIQPTKANIFSLVNTVGRTYTYRDVNVVVTANSYKYMNNPFEGKNVYINLGQFQVIQKQGKTTHLYTYVNTPKGSVVTDYGPKVSTATSNFTINLTQPKSANFPAKVTVNTKYKLDAGGIGSSYVQILSNPYNSLGDAALKKGEVLQVTQPLEYTNTLKGCNGSYVFTTMGGQYRYSDGFYMSEGSK